MLVVSFWLLFVYRQDLVRNGWLWALPHNKETLRPEGDCFAGLVSHIIKKISLEDFSSRLTGQASDNFTIYFPLRSETSYFSISISLPSANMHLNRRRMSPGRPARHQRHFSQRAYPKLHVPLIHDLMELLFLATTSRPFLYAQKFTLEQLCTQLALYYEGQRRVDRS